MLYLSPNFELFAKTEVLGAGQVLRARGQPLDSVLYLDSGRVAFGVCEDDQKKKMRHLFSLVEGPVWLDAAFALAQTPAPMDIVSDSRVWIKRVSLQDFQDSLSALPASAQALVRDMAQGYCQQAQTAVSRLAQAAEARFAQWLLRHAQAVGNGTLSVTLHQRKRSIAAQLGIAPETFSRVLRQLREHGLITGRGKVLSLPQPAALQSTAAMA